MGNLTATMAGPASAPHVVVSAHADEIGAVVAKIEPDGFLRLYPIGNLQARLLEGRAVRVGGQPGVIGARSGHLTSAAGVVTDAAAAHLAAGGIATLQIQIPRRYSHTPVEVLDLRDLAAALTLTEELVLNPLIVDELAFLHDDPGTAI